MSRSFMDYENDISSKDSRNGKLGKQDSGWVFLRLSKKYTY